MNLDQPFTKLKSYIESENFSGYDPYDTLNSFIPFHKLGKWPPVIAIQIQKRNPINIRPLLGIKKERNPKAIGLLLQAYSKLYQTNPKPEYKQVANELFQWLTDNYTKGYAGYCWGYNFPWASSEKYLPAYSPTAVVTGFVCRGIYEYSKISDNPKISQLINSASEFILNNLHTFEHENTCCISYTTLQPDCCYNASLLAAEVLLYDVLLNKNQKHLPIIDKACQFVINRQHNNGVWNYSWNPNTNAERVQIDFHQGYIIESLAIVNQLLKSATIDQAIKQGLAYYSSQFDDIGRAYYRIPKKFPVEIHNQAQGIITFSKLAYLHPNNKALATSIAAYTIKNMQHKQGYFYYKQYRHYTIKTPFMRWSQAWMFLALTHFIFDNQ